MVCFLYYNWYVDPSVGVGEMLYPPMQLLHDDSVECGCSRYLFIRSSSAVRPADQNMNPEIIMSDEWCKSSVMRRRNKETKQRRTEEASTSATKQQTGKQPTKQTRNQTNNRTSNQAKTRAGEQSNQQTKKNKHALLSKKPSMLGEWFIRKRHR